ncbi:OmpR subfamily protein (plasmid) [Leptolyngbya boryana NIES-2135]|jgi:DNA-binding response OmpR family regulator|uniref:OmpR subfamily protein n=1 Tax=Leptolyngbya boryana NIES-2135 TaxID=1973484 RepID=A0A1Z4JRM6_LEPBY|nr:MULTISPECIES: two-component system response regulator RppA [Leptolyngbya]BAY59382.1 OmpR subfamily protein [Leptolyngbya boryana NIES-2135]MBD2372970.1 response regulator transcription factor [Leptolyngbya sp. FACHB-238]MBD2397277.1 response regulator transcription factor [Leptolyngbya sp. FACHB-239]MBD2403917.1 response regulator transcription factor [Leptolyngbya sp. FACHB-402]ULP33213.1 response regulator transcription factor [Leptolyngbya boryana IU 594]
MRILLVEDEPDLGRAIEKTLTRNRYIVDWTQDGREAWSYLTQPQMQYTVAVIDWMLPGLSGIELCKRLRAQGSSLPVLMLTARDSLNDRVTGLDAGADDYLVKPFGMVELLARLRALQRRSPQIQPQNLQVGSLMLDYGSSTLVLQSQETATRVILTAKEFQLLEYLMKHANQIVSTEQIRNHLWTVNSESSSNVVAAQMRLLRRKLADQGVNGAIETVYGLGYRLNAESN